MLWLAGQTRDGYGRFRLNNRLVLAHRVSYALACGQIPDGLQVDHVKAKGCRHRHCVAPEHLEAVTGAENNRRSGSLTAANARKTHCPAGHEYTPENTYANPTAGRICRTCQRRQSAAYYARKALTKEGN